MKKLLTFLVVIMLAGMLWVSDGAVQSQTPQGLTLIYTSQSLGNLRNSVVQNDILYLAEEQAHKISVWDAYNPYKPKRFAEVDLTPIDPFANPLHILMRDNLLYITLGAGHGIAIVGVSNPSIPVIVGSLRDSRLTQAHGAFLYKNYLYVAAFLGDAFTIIDTNLPSNPIIVGSVTSPLLDGIHDISIDYPWAYVATHYGGSGGSGSPTEGSLVVLNVSDPANPQIVSYTETYSASNIFKKGIYVFVGIATALEVYDASNPLVAPTLVSSLPDTGGYWIDMTGKLAVVVDGADELFLVDASDPSNMFVLDTWLNPEGVFAGVRHTLIDGQFVYVTANNKLRIFRLFILERI